MIQEEIILNEFDKVAQRYSDSPYTTNAGKWLRFVAKIIPASTIIKMVSYKLAKK